MNNSEASDRPRRPPGPPDRPTATNGIGPSSNGTQATPAGRAEKFEDEKRRIIDSCFNKKDPTGAFLESYITHIRVTEDAAHPSTPPPPDSAPENKKHRLIIVAVRKSGRVRMHKARENANGTFSIGKTWVLDDLTTLQSFVGSTPSTSEEAKLKDWAAGTGFTVTIVKPYFWAAGTAKEKDFFIASLIKIYKKYTAGRIPELIGFDERETDQLLGGLGRPRAPSTGASSQPSESSSAQFHNRPPRSRDGSSRTPDYDVGRRPTPKLSTDFEPNRTGSPSKQDVGSRDGTPQLPNDPSRSGSPYTKENRSGSNAFQTAGSTIRSGLHQRPKTPESNYASPEPQFQTPPRSLAAIASPPERRRPPLPESTIKPPDISPPAKSEARASGLRGTLSRGNDGTGLNGAASIEPASGFKKSDMVRLGTPDTTDSASISSVKTQSVSTPPPDPPEEEGHRPGLGPMIKKKSSRDVAGAFRRAANAYNAFKPLLGGASTPIEEQSPSEAGEAKKNGAAETSPKPEEVPAVTITRAATDLAAELQNQGLKTPVATSIEQQATKSPGTTEARRQKRKSGQAAKYLEMFGISPAVLEPRHMEFEAILSEFGWDGAAGRSKKVELLQSEIKRELGRVEAGSWLGQMEAKDDRIEAVEKMLDNAIAECDELDGLLTLYSVELSTLDEDIAYIEAQSQGLQVQTANQKLLHAELTKLLDTISVSPSQLYILRDGDLESTKSQSDIESALALLYKAMVTIDPSLRPDTDLSARPGEDGLSFNSGQTGGYGNSELGSMRALKEKKDGYRNESISFLRRLRQFMHGKFETAMMETSRALERERNGEMVKRPGRLKLDLRNHDISRNELWRYSPLMMFTRDVDYVEWEEMFRSYEKSAKVVFQDEFREHVFNCKRSARKPTGDEQELLFTAQEKETDGLATTARKLTVKRSQTLAKSLRSAGDGESKKTSDRGGSLHHFEAFDAALEGMIPAIFMEQNFIVDFFHLSSQNQVDFIDAVSHTSPEERQGTELRTRKLFDPDRDLARKLADMMEEIFHFWPNDIQTLVEWAIKDDPLQGVGVMLSLERKLSDLDETNQEFLTRTIHKIHDRLAGLFSRFLDEQIRAIEETKVKIKKRKGVIPFMKTFPHFSTALETMLPPPDHQEDVDVREMVNIAYTRINTAMFDSLQTIAKDNPVATTTTTSHTQQALSASDPEDKQALNYHILLIENMNHYIEEVSPRTNPILETWHDRALEDLRTHMSLYLDAVTRRPLGKLLDLLESTESLLSSHLNPAEIPARASHSRATFKKVLSSYDGREIRRGAEALRKRVEKHFGDADDAALSRELVAKVLTACEERYDEVGERLKTVVREVYEDGLEVGWSRDDVAVAFRRGGTANLKKQKMPPRTKIAKVPAVRKQPTRKIDSKAKENTFVNPVRMVEAVLPVKGEDSDGEFDLDMDFVHYHPRISDLPPGVRPEDAEIGIEVQNPTNNPFPFFRRVKSPDSLIHEYTHGVNPDPGALDGFPFFSGEGTEESHFSTTRHREGQSVKKDDYGRIYVTCPVPSFDHQRFYTENVEGDGHVFWRSLSRALWKTQNGWESIKLGVRRWFMYVVTEKGHFRQETYLNLRDWYDHAIDSILDLKFAVLATEAVFQMVVDYLGIQLLVLTEKQDGKLQWAVWGHQNREQVFLFNPVAGMFSPMSPVVPANTPPADFQYAPYKLGRGIRRNPDPRLMPTSLYYTWPYPPLSVRGADIITLPPPVNNPSKTTNRNALYPFSLYHPALDFWNREYQPDQRAKYRKGDITGDIAPRTIGIKANHKTGWDEPFQITLRDDQGEYYVGDINSRQPMVDAIATNKRQLSNEPGTDFVTQPSKRFKDGDAILSDKIRELEARRILAEKRVADSLSGLPIQKPSGPPPEPIEVVEDTSSDEEVTEYDKNHVLDAQMALYIAKVEQKILRHEDPLESSDDDQALDDEGTEMKPSGGDAEESQGGEEVIPTTLEKDGDASEVDSLFNEVGSVGAK
ncbi:MAG: hypothetical protein M1814_002285 [Vezdaea aestivalis]|nr:MAG: hypothetical protein M1814_002285 [Vezdaea aestivalis]